MAEAKHTDPVVREAYELSHDYIGYVTGRVTGPAPSPAACALRFAGDELVEKFPIFFKRWPRVFRGVTEDTACDLLIQTIDDNMREFWDRQKRQTGYPLDIPWSMVLSIYVLAGQMAIHCKENGMEKVLEPLAERVGHYMEENFCPVIRAKDGWVGFTKRYREKENVEGKVLQICLAVLITLLALLLTHCLWKRKMASL
ncbi:bcl-2-related ovarian killer protein homolog A-like [Aquarana catesbeiana]|uniref:bcl-2-related ovarian killer protein homolog A-like n=1 Tax=Aquarana catesbeiana TaxID=8400 RepID=UPI003CC9D267